jgi:hypothetical protein
MAMITQSEAVVLRRRPGRLLAREVRKRHVRLDDRAGSGVIWLFYTGADHAREGDQAMGRPLVTTVGLGLGIASGLASVVIYRRARRYSAPSAGEVRESDRRPPVLLLRSFDDDWR